MPNPVIINEYPPIVHKYIVRSEINQRENNEDSTLVLSFVHPATLSTITLLAIADGMGGHAHGEDASKEALKKLSTALLLELAVEPSINNSNGISTTDVDMISSALMNGLEQSNYYIRRMVETNNWGKAGSTIVAAIICGDCLVVANLGDSPLFHYQNSEKKVSKITDDHTVTGALLRAGMITEEMAKYHEGRNQLEFYLGAQHLPKHEPIYKLQLAASDILLLCSDGISGKFTVEQISEILSNMELDLNTKAEQLISKAVEMGETDNQTLILWQSQCEQPVTNTIDKNKVQQEEKITNVNHHHYEWVHTHHGSGEVF